MVTPVHRWGSGPTRLWLLHGFTGTAHAFDHLEPLLGSQVSAHVPLLPGHGGSASPAGGRAGFVATVQALARLIEPGDVLAGYSMGARLALGTVLLGGARPARLILESGTAGLRRHQDRARRRADDEALAQRIEHDGLDAFIARWEALPLFAGVREQPKPVLAALASRRRSHEAKGLAAALRGLGLGAQPSLWSRLPRLSMPLLCVTGARDRKFTPLGAMMSAAAPLGYHVALDAGHAPHLERPREWARELVAFSTAPFPARIARAEEAA